MKFSGKFPHYTGIKKKIEQIKINRLFYYLNIYSWQVNGEVMRKSSFIPESCFKVVRFFLKEKL